MSPIRLSIIIPFYKQIDFLLRGIRSIKVSLDKANISSDFELIIINDSPSFSLNTLQENLDANFEKAFTDHIHILSNKENCGVAISRNVGLDYARGEFIHILDQDDEIREDFYELNLQALQSADWVLSNGYFENLSVNKKHLIYLLSPSLTIDNFILDDFVRSPGQVVFKRSLVSTCRFIAPVKYKGADDRFFWILMYGLSPNMKTKYLSEPLYIAHLHNDNFSHDSQELYRSSKELWDAMPLDVFASKQKLIKRNKLAIDYVLNLNRSMPAFIEYFRYKYRFNRMLRFIIKHTFA
ncbi:MAG: hypothetical protein CFE21_12155 [Bacteroidetes bacterium B1(2017)]|nr:MAG: hypothetical protein CFE21_12155 [Bacteroidetes bacterium B1(2017)]